ncbi:caspase family protein [Bradyrhizobium ontarionense]|uniref:Caspase family protein n=1 Tax=Bradyrhizobium ontarionense TaxID=2898149 RepID=A0ABY3RLC1_9BRAD|nr:caspase family protein [Bradyrhizobium sp. A19]UFZ07424.1 caspase family protein [Bradyrhizobium sp. A19]
MLRTWLALSILALTCGLARAGVDETYIRPTELPSWSDLYKNFFGSNEFGKSYAVVIGIGDYDVYPKLDAPASDATRMRDFLRDEAGFDYIVTLTDERASRSRIETLMEKTLPKLVGANDRVLLYFSGHGETRKLAGDTKRGYLILKPAGKEDWDEMLDMPRVIQWAENVGQSRHSLFILDACFSGLAALQVKGTVRDQTIGRLSQPAHQLVTAGVEDELSFASQGESLFTKAFIEAARGTRRPAPDGVASLSEIMLDVGRSIDEYRSTTGMKRRMSPRQYLLSAKNNAGEFFFLQKERLEKVAARAPDAPQKTGDPVPKGHDGQAGVPGGKPQGGGDPARIPGRVTLDAYTVLFDPANGKPLLWFSRFDQEYEFFDGPGFHPRSGEKLLPFTSEEAKKFQKLTTERAEALKKEKEQLEKSKAEREARDAAARDALAKKQEEDRKLREAEAARASGAGQHCDELAANPNDKNKVGPGVSFAVLKSQAAEAVKTCEAATKQSPNELRFKYQLARSLQFSDRARAFTLFQDLVSKRYPASFDNLGWMQLTDKNNPAQAVSMFRSGVQAGDVDSMVSLAEMIDRGQATAANPSETKMELCRRASELGHLGAAQCYQAEVAKLEQAEKDRVQKLEQQKVMMEVIGTVLQTVTKR